MIQYIIIRLANLLASADGSPNSGKKIVLIGPNKKFISEYIKISPDVDANLVATKSIDKTPNFCNFLATTDYENIKVLYHGYSTGLTLNEEKGIDASFSNILYSLQNLPIKSKIKEIEFLSCLAGNSAKAIFQIAQVLKTKIIAHTFLRGRVTIKFSGVNEKLIKNLEVFKNYIVFGVKDADIKTLLKNHRNTLTFQWYSPSYNPEAFRTELQNVNFSKADRYELNDKLWDFQNKRYRSGADATHIDITDITTATNQEKEYQSPQLSLFERIQFIPPIQPSP